MADQTDYRNREESKDRKAAGIVVGRVVIVRGYKTRTDGSSEEPGIINGVVDNPTAEELQKVEEARAKVDAADVAAKKTPAARPSGLSAQSVLTAEVSPCRVDIAVFPYRADHRNLQDVPFFESRDKAIEYYEAQPKSTDGAVGCVAYFPEKVDPKHDAKVRDEKAAKERAAREQAEKDAADAAKKEAKQSK